MVHFLTSALHPKGVNLTGAVGTASFAKDQWQLTISGAKQFVASGLRHDLGQMLRKTNATLFIKQGGPWAPHFETLDTREKKPKPSEFMTVSLRFSLPGNLGPSG